MIKCANHPVRDADYHCPRCQVPLCGSCVNYKQFTKGKLEICPSCNDIVTNLEKFKPVQPFWEKIPYFLMWPIAGEAWMYLVGWSFAALVLKGLGTVGMHFPPFGTVGAIFLYTLYFGYLFNYFYVVVSKAEEGKFKVPDFSEFRGFLASFVQIVFFVMSVMAVFWPVIIISIALFILQVAAVGVFQEYGLALMIPSGFITLILFLAGLFLLPMSLMVMGIFKNPIYVLNPLFLIMQIKKIFKEYLIAVAIIVGFLIFYTIIKTIFSLVLGAIGGMMYLLVFPVDGALQLYMFMFLGHLLGYMGYQTRYKLKWWPENLDEPAFMVNGQSLFLDGKPAGSGANLIETAVPGQAGASMGGTSMGGGMAAGVAGAGMAAGGAAMAGSMGGPMGGAGGGPGMAPPPSDFGGGVSYEQEELTRKINDGMSMMQHGRNEEARDLFLEVLAENPNHLSALRGVVMAALKLKDMDLAAKYGKKQAEMLAQQQAFDAMHEMCTELKKSVKNFVPEPRPQFALAKWLLQENRPLDAARCLRELGVTYPDDPLAPKALYQCAEVLWKQCDKAQNALQMYQYILKRYPDVPYADQIQHAVQQLQSGG